MKQRGAIAKLRVFAQAPVERDHVQRIQMLALVLVDALDLDVEQRIGIDDDARAFMNPPREPLFVEPLDAAPAFAKRGVAGMRLEGFEAREIGDPALAERLVEQCRERRIAQHEEPARRDAVRDVVEAFRPELREIAQHRLP